MKSCFVYKYMGITCHDRINTQLIYRLELAQVVARMITKPQSFFRFESHWLLFLLFIIFIQFFFFIFWGGGGGGWGLILLFSSCLFFFLFIF